MCKSFDDLKKEADKCDLLCRCCHAERHHNLHYNVRESCYDLDNLMKLCAKKTGSSLFVEKVCLVCDKTYPVSQERHDERKYCSPRCYGFSSRRVERPSSKEEFEALVWSIPTQRLAERFGVTDSAIVKWAKSFGVNKPPRGYWSKKKAGKLQ